MSSSADDITIISSFHISKTRDNSFQTVLYLCKTTSFQGPWRYGIKHITARLLSLVMLIGIARTSPIHNDDRGMQQ